MGDAPRDMNALRYEAPRDFSIVKVPIPKVGPKQALVKAPVSSRRELWRDDADLCACPVLSPTHASTPQDAHIHEGEFIAKFPLISGHEIVGVVHEVGSEVEHLKVGDRVVADVGETCGDCFYCVRGTTLFCEHFEAHGVTMDGGFSDYCKLEANKLFRFENMTDEEATLCEPASCAIHGLDKLQPKLGCEALIIGAGPTGLMLAQLLRQAGAAKVVLAANAGMKMKIAREVNAADVYIDLDRQNAKDQWADIKKNNPYGFDVVVEATGVESLIQDSINYVRRGGTLLVYGVYSDAARVHWPPNKIFLDEIRVIGSFSQTHCFPRAVAYLDSGRVKTKGMVTSVFPLDKYQDALDLMNSRQAMKIAITPGLSK
ncbi:uncharacterized protein L969DRAFT_17435 [Mixia osmundae IAM 14324]|uniref:uncharacterized protein n=1 Tax=Mixia osmundae (strain CBS 9802 / IAM 14324 / JCM 22182 / KY 12970) TaxID=764103 RepID=UPI0004A548E0|nr:uncharacterized protein L969DRAFT_17435 [Mixia osmundae IAM 14324]KEI39514.1 hypothetical protein L969DRAFT_17435 [Mixia osmundae IAM 14324]